ncbi:hypothetical protein HKX48_007469 [Thoreauomyces humboldtii]|nr:hypothetical protein HKX48_007469 [Thoreauomyces humboldtii]
MESILSQNAMGQPVQRLPSAGSAAPHSSAGCTRASMSSSDSDEEQDAPRKKRARVVKSLCRNKRSTGDDAGGRDNGDGITLVADGNGFFTFHGFSSFRIDCSPRYRKGVLKLPFNFPLEDKIGAHSSNSIDTLLPCISLSRHDVMELVSVYFAMAHPLLPIVDRSNFYVTITEGPDTHPFRCLLYAVLIVAAHLSLLPKIPNSVIENLCNMCQQVMVDYEVSHVWISQAALVLSMVNSLKGAKFHRLIKNNWKLVGIAVRSAQEVGLHRSLRNIKRPVPPNDVSTAEETRRRTWAGCYIMDRITSTYTGRPCMIHDQDWDALPPQGYSDVAEERADSEYLSAQMQFARISGVLLQRVNAAHAAPEEVGASGETLLEDLQAQLEEWRGGLPASLSLPDDSIADLNSKRGWTRRELLHLRFHTAVLIIRRRLLGRYDREAVRSASAVISLIGTFSRPATLTSPSATAPSNRVPSILLLFAGMPMSAMIAWDALFQEVLTGNADALESMNRLHEMIQRLAYGLDHVVFRVHLMLWADTLDARGIANNLSHKKIKALIDKTSADPQSPTDLRLHDIMGDASDTSPHTSPSEPASIHPIISAFAAENATANASSITTLSHHPLPNNIVDHQTYSATQPYHGAETGEPPQHYQQHPHAGPDLSGFAPQFAQYQPPTPAELHNQLTYSTDGSYSSTSLDYLSEFMKDDTTLPWEWMGLL